MFDPTSDFETIADGLDTVTLTRPGTALLIEIPNALRRAILRRDTVDSDGRYTASDFVWHLPVAAFEETPQAGDVLIDNNGARWTILGVRPATFGSRWHCVCRNLATAYGLNVTVDIEKAVFAKSDAGAELLSWESWRTGLDARIQPATTRLQPTDEHTQIVDRFHIYLLDDIEIEDPSRVRTADGTTYKILSSHRRQRLDELMYLSVLKNP